MPALITSKGSSTVNSIFDFESLANKTTFKTPIDNAVFYIDNCRFIKRKLQIP